MALHRENPAFTTHGLTPRPQNRPLKIAKLTPCKNPVATGSAGHCEPGVGRFTDPHPFTCSSFTPYLHCFMFGQCRLPQLSPSPSSEWRIISFSIEANPVPQCAAFAEPAGPAFSFSAYLRFLSTASLRVETHWFPLTLGWPLSLDSLTTGSHATSLPGPQNRTQGHTGASLALISFSWCTLGWAGLPNPRNECILASISHNRF